MAAGGFIADFAMVPIHWNTFQGARIRDATCGVGSDTNNDRLMGRGKTYAA